nr:MAG TPA: hypothetical protein [Caudoviricetes sp.]
MWVSSFRRMCPRRHFTEPGGERQGHRYHLNREPCLSFCCPLDCRCGPASSKEVAPMWTFLTDVAAQIVASVVAALIIRQLMK